MRVIHYYCLRYNNFRITIYSITVYMVQMQKYLNNKHLIIIRFKTKQFRNSTIREHLVRVLPHFVLFHPSKHHACPSKFPNLPNTRPATPRIPPSPYKFWIDRGARLSPFQILNEEGSFAEEPHVPRVKLQCATIILLGVVLTRVRNQSVWFSGQINNNRTVKVWQTPNEHIAQVKAGRVNATKDASL